MAERGLAQRLSQRSRRAGLMIGLSMGLTITLCVGSFAFIYAALDPLTSDFVSRENVGSVETPTQAAAQAEAQATAPPAENQPQQPAPTPTPAPTTPPATPPPDTFTPDYQIAFTSVNLRSVPSATQGNATIVTTLPPGTPLQYLNEDSPAERPEDGARWMRFRTEEGDEGWIRELDVEPFVP